MKADIDLMTSAGKKLLRRTGNDGLPCFIQGGRDPDASRVVIVQEQGWCKTHRLTGIDGIACAVAHLTASAGANRGEPLRISIAYSAPDVLWFRVHAHGGNNVQRITGTEESVQCLLA